MNNFSKSFSRRNFLAGASSLGAFYAAARFALPLPALAAPLLDDPAHRRAAHCRQGFRLRPKDWRRLCTPQSRTVRRVCRRAATAAFLIGRDAAIMVEGFQSTARLGISIGNVALAHATARARGASTRTGTSITRWAIPFTAARESPSGRTPTSRRVWPRTTPSGSRRTWPLTSSPWEKRVREAKTDSQREHFKSDIEGLVRDV